MGDTKTKTPPSLYIGYCTAVLCTFMLPSALLPSVTWMTVWCVAAGCLQNGRHYCFVVICVIATLATGWPFGAVCVLPMALEVVRREYYHHHAYDSSSSASSSRTTKMAGATGGAMRRLGRLLLFIGTVTVVTQGIVMHIDRHYYGAWVSATYNIFRYNAQNSHDALYGVEPLSYYVKNLLLNLNYTAILGMCALPIYLLLGAAQDRRRRQSDGITIATLASLYPWVAITFPRPHKEERFLYPIYPVLIYGAVLVVDELYCTCILPFLLSRQDKNKVKVERQPQPPAHESRRSSGRWWWRPAFLVLVFTPSLLISISRNVALSRYYAAPLKVYASVPNNTNNATVCVCGEWYRFPGSFFVGRLVFLPSSFRGQLPQPFSIYGSRKESQDVLQPFNDQNRHEPDRYASLNDGICDYIVDIENGDCPQGGKVIASEPFLDASRTSLLHRILYIPYLHEYAMRTQRGVHYLQYRLMTATMSPPLPPLVQQVRTNTLTG
jgi:alpha-1,2-mannosyltransferase